MKCYANVLWLTYPPKAHILVYWFVKRKHPYCQTCTTTIIIIITIVDATDVAAAPPPVYMMCMYMCLGPPSHPLACPDTTPTITTCTIPTTITITCTIPTTTLPLLRVQAQNFTTTPLAPIPPIHSISHWTADTHTHTLTLSLSLSLSCCESGKKWPIFVVFYVSQNYLQSTSKKSTVVYIFFSIIIISLTFKLLSFAKVFLFF